MSAAGQGAAPVSRGAHEGLATIVESMAVEPEPTPATKSSESSRVATPGAPLPGSAAGRVTWSTEEAPLNRNYTFEQFVVGSCNRLAHAAALASSEQPGQAYNPLFVHGNVGLGKSHLLQAIGNAILRRSHEARLIYISCEEFTNRYIRSIESREVDRFRKYHRTADVLIVDDVDFLANKERTQEEFFHTFNDLYNAGKQIVLSSDRPPPEIPALEERLVSRFKWGLVVDIDRPCFETRVAILKRKAKMRSVELPDEVAYYVAKRIDTNIRELEGALIKLIGVAAITERVLSLNLAQEALHDVQPSKSYHVALTEIMSLVTSEFAISARDITGKNRTQAISFPRQVGMYLSRMHTEHSLEEIGKFFGNRDHTTVLYAVTKIRERAQSDRVLKELLASLATRLIRR
jgi:chromosomal replication initiator protein